MSQTNEPPKKNAAEMMRALRLKMLTTRPSEFGQKPTSDFPRVGGVLMDWPLNNGTISVVSLSTGDASLYSTGTFGVIGGIGHEAVRTAAKNFVMVAEKHYDEAAPTKEFPYPQAGHLIFYFVGYDEVRMIDASVQSVTSGKDKCSDLFAEGQRVITQLRLITQKQKATPP